MAPHRNGHTPVEGVPLPRHGSRWDTSDGVPEPVDREVSEALSAPVTYPDATPRDAAPPPIVQQIAAEVIRQQSESESGGRRGPKWERYGAILGVVLALLVIGDRLINYGKSTSALAQRSDVERLAKETTAKLQTTSARLEKVERSIFVIEYKVGQIARQLGVDPGVEP